MFILKAGHVQTRFDIQYRGFWNCNSWTFLHGSQKMWSIIGATSEQGAFHLSASVGLQPFCCNQLEAETASDEREQSKTHFNDLSTLWHPLYQEKHVIVRLTDGRSIATRSYCVLVTGVGVGCLRYLAFDKLNF